MSTEGPGGPRPSKNERRDAAREKARALREEQKKRERRNRFLIGGGIALGAIAVIAIVVVVIVMSIRPAGPGPANMATDGIKIGEGFVAETTAALAADEEPKEPSANPANVVDIRIWVDYQCPVCGAFEAANSEQVRGWVEDGSVTWEVHPIAFLDPQSQGTKYSSRSSNAAACVANYSPDNFFDFSELMFKNQPKEGTPGLDDDTIIGITEEAGVTNADDIAKCVKDQEFRNWVGDATQRAFAGPIPDSDIQAVSGTPTIIVNGVRYTGAIDDADEFAAFVLAQSSTPEATATPTPTPTPTQ
jgi:protein-disulfide isomerase